MADTKQILKDLIEDHIDKSALTKDDDASLVNCQVMFERPPRILLRDLVVDHGVDLLFTVGRLRVEAKHYVQEVPKLYDGRYTIKIWTIDKTGITGEKLRWKAIEALEDVFEDNPSGTSPYQLQYVSSEEDDDYMLDGTTIYTTIFIISHKRYET